MLGELYLIECGENAKLLFLQRCGSLNGYFISTLLPLSNAEAE